MGCDGRFGGLVEEPGEVAKATIAVGARARIEGDGVEEVTATVVQPRAIDERTCRKRLLVVMKQVDDVVFDVHRESM